jgi:hypothetical protein
MGAGPGLWGNLGPLALVFRRRYNPEPFRKRESASLAVSLVRINVDSISTHLHASIRLTLRCLFANSVDKLYRSFGLCVPFARRGGESKP